MNTPTNNPTFTAELMVYETEEDHSNESSSCIKEFVIPKNLSRPETWLENVVLCYAAARESNHYAYLEDSISGDAIFSEHWLDEQLAILAKTS